ncbi:MAG: Crp/Fnr family transcriptional regulator [Candidatus Korobacteraceae bacterium]|jgi:CRP-like cAMP-binding protein
MPSKRGLSFNPGKFLQRIGSDHTSQEYGNKQLIFSQGDVANAMFYVETGNVKLTVLSKGGKKAVIAILRQGDCFGEGCLGIAPSQMSTATAVHSTTVVRVEKAIIVRIIHDDPTFARLFIGHLLSRVARMEENLLDQLFNSSEKRLARTLLALANLSTKSKVDSAVLKVSQGTLAEMVGTTRSRVSFFMNRFRKMGLIDYNGNLHVHRALLTFLLLE